MESASHSSGGSKSDEETAEDDEDSSSSLRVVQSTDLEEFRLQWRNELAKREPDATSSYSDGVSENDSENNIVSTKTSKPEKSYASVVAAGDPIEQETFEKAKQLFLDGVRHEQERRMHDAISCYRLSLRLVPDIERKLFCSSVNVQRSSQHSRASSHPRSGRRNSLSESDEFASLYHKFISVLLSDQSEIVYCTPQFDQRACHISVLPMEVILMIFRWVVSEELDTRMLEQVSLVCSGFYVLARDPELWHAACVRTWNSNISGAVLIDEGAVAHVDPISVWRNLYITRPHVLTYGVYISKMSYIRHGETSFQDTNYRPWHMVIYFRYLRFFADGTCLMYTSADDPFQAIPYLRNRNVRNYSQVLQGKYHGIGYDCFAAEFRKERRADLNGVQVDRRKAVTDYENEQLFALEMQIVHGRGKSDIELQWLNYDVLVKFKYEQFVVFVFFYF